MKYELIGNIMPAVEITMNSGESMYTQSGGMCWMSPDVKMSTNTRGGFLKGIGRIFAGESLFMATYTATSDTAIVAFSATVPGEILPVNLDGYRQLICQKGAFLCAENSVNAEVTFTKKLSSGFFGGEGFILQKLSGSGMAFLEIDGNKIIKDLAPGECLKVDTGNLVAFEDTVHYEVEMVKGGMNIFLGGEGLFLTRLTGPGRVILQTQNFAEFAGRIASFIPTSS
ncbi:MAG: TIGR00266 family protein [Lachnospiraceae bacterium]|nr:TIGR00266 family protein [Lachnospiraceae bacterium]